jgi:hypothetical protein
VTETRDEEVKRLRGELLKLRAELARLAKGAPPPQEIADEPHKYRHGGPDHVPGMCEVCGSGEGDPIHGVRGAPKAGGHTIPHRGEDPY